MCAAVALVLSAKSEPEFLKILKYNLAESASAGFQFNCFDIFDDKTLNYRLLDHLSGLLKCIQKNIFYQQTTTIACPTLLYSLTFEKTALHGKSTFQPPING